MLNDFSLFATHTKWWWWVLGGGGGGGGGGWWWLVVVVVVVVVPHNGRTENMPNRHPLG